MTNYEFVLYNFKPAQQDSFRQALANHYNGVKDISFGGVYPGLENIAADQYTDRVVTVQTGHLSKEQVHELFEAVKAAARDCNCAMCPIRDEHGEKVDHRESKFAKWKRKLHL